MSDDFKSIENNRAMVLDRSLIKLMRSPGLWSRSIERFCVDFRL